MNILIIIFLDVDDIIINLLFEEDGKILGDFSDGVPPLPIPNREVKPISANGTAFAGE